MTYEECSSGIKLILCLINTGAFLSEIFTPVMGVTHSLIGPTAILTVYVLIGCQIIASCCGRYGTEFFQMYSTVACICVELAFAAVAFKEVEVPEVIKDGTGHLILNGVLPIIMTIFLIADFVLIFCSFRDEGPVRSNTFSNLFANYRLRSRLNTSDRSNVSAKK